MPLMWKCIQDSSKVDRWVGQRKNKDKGKFIHKVSCQSSVGLVVRKRLMMPEVGSVTDDHNPVNEITNAIRY